MANLKEAESGVSVSAIGKNVPLEANHGKGSKSVDLVRRQWENGSNDSNGSMTTPTALAKRNCLFVGSPRTPAMMPIEERENSTRSDHVASPIISPDNEGSLSSTGFGDHNTGGKYKSAYMAARAMKQGTIDSGDATSESIETSRLPAGGSEDHPQPSSASHGSILSPAFTGSSSIESGRSRAIEDTLATARANALKRLEARKRAKAGLAETEIVTTPVLADRMETKKASPFGDLFIPPVAADLTPTKPTSIGASPMLAGTPRPSKSLIAPSPTPMIASPDEPYSALSARQSQALRPPSPVDAPASPNTSDKYGSISRTDRRRLGRHLPRIASGGVEPDSEKEYNQPRRSSGRRVPSTLGIHPDSSSSTENIPPISNGSAAPSTSGNTDSIIRLNEVLPSTMENLPKPKTIASAQSTAKRKSAYLPHTPNSSISNAFGTRLLSPRPEVAGAEMKGLMSAIGAMPARGSSKEDGEGVSGELGIFRENLIKA